MASYAALRVPSGVLSVLSQAMPNAIGPVVSSLGFITTMTYWLGLYGIGRHVTDGDESWAFRFLLFTGACDAGVDLAWWPVRTCVLT